MRGDVRSGAAGVEVSFDGGTTWREASLSGHGDGRYTARWFNPRSAEGQDVTLRLSARDAEGGTLTQTVEGAYRTANVSGWSRPSIRTLSASNSAYDSAAAAGSPASPRHSARAPRAARVLGWSEPSRRRVVADIRRK